MKLLSLSGSLPKASSGLVCVLLSFIVQKLGLHHLGHYLDMDRGHTETLVGSERLNRALSDSVQRGLALFYVKVHSLPLR